MYLIKVSLDIDLVSEAREEQRYIRKKVISRNWNVFIWSLSGAWGKIAQCKATIIGSSWHSPLKEIEIQLTFIGIVMEFQLSLVWLCACLSQGWRGSQERKGCDTAGAVTQLFWGWLEREWYSRDVSELQCTSEPITDRLPVLVLIWKWLEVGCNSCHGSVFNGETKFNKRRLDYDNSIGLEAIWDIYIEPVLWIYII